MLAEIRVQGGKQEIEQAVAEQHDFDPQRNGIGFERNRAGQAEKAADVLDGDLAAPQRALERGPAERLDQQGARVDEQIAAARAMHGAGLDQAEIGHQHAVRRDVFDAADQVAERRMQLFDQRRAGGAVLRDQDVDFVAVERGPLQRLRRLAFAAVAAGDEHRDVLD